MVQNTLTERLRRARERAVSYAARHLPRRLAYWTLIDLGVRHIRHDEVVPDVTFIAILQRTGDELT